MLQEKSKAERIPSTLAIIVSFSALFSVFLWGWIRNGGMDPSGLYSQVDGQLAAWYAKALTQWSTPWQTHVLNPFQGMVSMFIPNSPWWNPAALLLSLPFSTVTNYILSYTIYWCELCFSGFLLAKALGLNKLESVFASQLLVLFLFPVTSSLWWGFPLLSISPFNAHIMSLANIMVVLFIQLGKARGVYNFYYILLMLFCGFIYLMSAPFTFLTYVPVYGLICVGLMLQNRDPRSIAWKLFTLLLMIGILLVLKLPAYFQNTADSVARITESNSTINIGFAWPPQWQNYNCCSGYLYSMHLLSVFCSQRTPIYYPLFLGVFAFVGGLIGLFWRSLKYRWVAAMFCFLIMVPDTLIFLIHTGVLKGHVTTISPVYYLWATLSFSVIFLVVFASFLWEMLVKTISSLLKLCLPSGLLKFNMSAIPFLPKLLVILSMLVVPSVAMWPLFETQKMPIVEPRRTPIIDYLQKQVALSPGTPFKGNVVSYFASSDSPLRYIFWPEELNGPFRPDHYIQSRHYLRRKHGNMYMFSDLWQYNIPTLEEYGEWVSLASYRFFTNLLAEPRDNFFRDFLNVYTLDLKVLRALGARFIITDKKLDKEGLSFILEQKPYHDLSMPDVSIPFEVTKTALQEFEKLKEEAKRNGSIERERFIKMFKEQLESSFPTSKLNINKVLDGFFSAEHIVFKNTKPEKFLVEELNNIKRYFYGYLLEFVNIPLYLYELSSPNLGTFSPTLPREIHSGPEMFSVMKDPDFSFEKFMVVQQKIPYDLVPVSNVNVAYGENEVVIDAKSHGWSFLLLPMQYSHCLQLEPNSDSLPISPEARLIRANLIHTGLLFKENIHAKIRFRFGIGVNVNCKREDVVDLNMLKF